ncbi:hypothetical protein L2750_12415 [Shewanella submarina]|uniref:Uncharacterized protein n=1 Tax=Shewanella submarina TaxID=2016376 RepID=A0ABV7GGV5_9GAMM|nr:hypothetical protein [Shewanella submarina]MCL1037953.1 hypothetical protein [Shewanella submarina]
MKLKILLILLLTLAAAGALFHFKTHLGLFVLPLFMGLVVFVTLWLYKLLSQDENPEL